LGVAAKGRSQVKRRRLTLSAEASADLDEIRLHTAEQFGEDQARRYLAGLRNALDLLTTQPGMGTLVQSSSEIRCWIHRGHYRVLYRDRGNHLEIGRILHTAREAEYQRALRFLLHRSGIP
jgi:plasmid stabilization system protein ParE